MISMAFLHVQHCFFYISMSSCTWKVKIEIKLSKSIVYLNNVTKPHKKLKSWVKALQRFFNTMITTEVFYI